MSRHFYRRGMDSFSGYDDDFDERYDRYNSEDEDSESDLNEETVEVDGNPQKAEDSKSVDIKPLLCKTHGPNLSDDCSHCALQSFEVFHF